MRKALAALTLTLLPACASAPPTSAEPSFATAIGESADACTDRCLDRAERTGAPYAECVSECPGSVTRPAN